MSSTKLSEEKIRLETSADHAKDSTNCIIQFYSNSKSTQKLGKYIIGATELGLTGRQLLLQSKKRKESNVDNQRRRQDSSQPGKDLRQKDDVVDSPQKIKRLLCR